MLSNCKVSLWYGSGVRQARHPLLNPESARGHFFTLHTLTWYSSVLVSISDRRGTHLLEICRRRLARRSHNGLGILGRVTCLQNINPMLFTHTHTERRAL